MKSFKLPDNVRRTVAICRILTEKRGVHSVIEMNAAGFDYTGDKDTAYCKHCGLEAFNWTADMKPFLIHSEESPHCPYVRSKKPASLLDVLEPSASLTITTQTTSISNEQENPPKHRKIDLKSRLNPLFEPDSLEQCRRNTFCQWPHGEALSRECMAQAGFFSCNNNDDRCICLHCDLTCEQWTPNLDNPVEVHKALSPGCLYVKQKFDLTKPLSIMNDNISSITATATTPIHAPNNTNPFPLSTFARPVAHIQRPNAIYKPAASAPTCPVENSRSIDELIRTNTASGKNQFDVNEFCCNYLLDHWDPDDNSKIEDDLWFPLWVNGKQLYGEKFYQKIQETIRAHQLRAMTTKLSENPHVITNLNQTRNSRQSLMNNKSILSVIIRCWQSKLQEKHQCSVCYRDLLILRFIQQKLMEPGKKILIPYLNMIQISEKAIKIHQEKYGQTQISVEPCVVCLAEERRLAFLPCGHLATCVPCGHSLHLCPLCRQQIKLSVNISINV